jgi:hypothetical protein
MNLGERRQPFLRPAEMSVVDHLGFKRALKLRAKMYPGA